MSWNFLVMNWELLWSEMDIHSLQLVSLGIWLKFKTNHPLKSQEIIY